MKCIFGPAAMSGRIGEQWNEFEHLDKASRPSVRNDQWQCRRRVPPYMYEVNVESVNCDSKLRQPI